MNAGRHEREATIDCGDRYLALHRVCCGLARTLSPDELATAVPATPAWTVRDVFCHVTGLVADLNAARLPGEEGPDAWGAAQIESRRTLALTDVLAEWEREAPAFADGLRLFGYEWGSHFFADLLVHLHDVQAALGRAAHDDATDIAIAIDHYTGFLAEALATTPGWGSLAIRAGGEDWLVGDGQLRLTLHGSAREVLRCLCARRSARQMRDVSTGDLDGFLALLTSAWQVGYSVPHDDQP